MLATTTEWSVLGRVGNGLYLRLLTITHRRSSPPSTEEVAWKVQTMNNKESGSAAQTIGCRQVFAPYFHKDTKLIERMPRLAMRCGKNYIGLPYLARQREP